MKREDGDSELLTLDQAAERLGWDGGERPPNGGRTARAARLLAAVESRERETRFRVIHRRGKGSPIRVTMLALREHLPELFPGSRSQLDVEGRFTRALRSIDDRIARRCDPLDDRITQAEHENHVTREMVVQLAESTAGIPHDEETANQQNCSGEASKAAGE